MATSNTHASPLQTHDVQPPVTTSAVLSTAALVMYIHTLLHTPLHSTTQHHATSKLARLHESCNQVNPVNLGSQAPRSMINQRTQVMNHNPLEHASSADLLLPSCKINPLSTLTHSQLLQRCLHPLDKVLRAGLARRCCCCKPSSSSSSTRRSSPG